MNDNDELKIRSGSITIESKLVSFLYQLIRDHMTIGEIEKIVRESQESVVTYSNGYLAQYAKDIADKLK